MSETRTAGEIEDILSSIRRLVSEDSRPAARPQIISRMVVEDKLILTPALRVVSSRAPAKAAEFPPPSAASPASPPVAAPLPRLHLGRTEAEPTRAAVVETLAQAVDQQKLDWESETGDPGPDAESIDWSSFTFTRRPLRDMWSEGDARVGAQAAEKIAGQIADTPTGQTAAGQTATVTSAAPVEVQPRPAPWAQPDPEEPAASAEVKQAAAAADPAWVDAAEARAVADLDTAAANRPAEPAAEQGVAEKVTDQIVDDIFSEDVLRELVRDLIREQLQGELGERITRNIRKLVKAEIARAIAVQRLE